MPFHGTASITYQQLRVFAAVARERSFVRAARTLSLTEPAVSSHVRQLERVVGMTLLARARGHRSVDLTGAGRVLLETCASMFDTLDRGLETMRSRYGNDPSTVIVGSVAGSNFGGNTLPRLAELFRREHPDIDVVIDIDSTLHLTEMLHREAIHLAVVVGSGDDPDLVYEPYVDFSVYLIGPAGHRLSSTESADIRELEREDFIAPDEPVANRLGVDRLMSEAGVQLRTVMVSPDTLSRLQAVAMGFGITLMHLPSPDTSAIRGLRPGEVSILNVDGFPLRLKRYLAYRKGHLSRAASEFRSHLLRHRDLLDDPATQSADRTPGASRVAQDKPPDKSNLLVG